VASKCWKADGYASTNPGQLDFNFEIPYNINERYIHLQQDTHNAQRSRKGHWTMEPKVPRDGPHSHLRPSVPTINVTVNNTTGEYHPPVRYRQRQPHRLPIRRRVQSYKPWTGFLTSCAIALGIAGIVALSLPIESTLGTTALFFSLVCWSLMYIASWLEQ
jgi:hypothetical protein